MKKTVFAAMILLFALLLCCCTRTDVPTEPPTTPPTTQTDPPTDPPTEPPTDPPTEPTEPEPELPAMGTVNITTLGAITDEYSDALVSVQWDTGVIEEQTVQIRHRGVTSMTAPKKSYNIKFSGKVSLFGMDSGKKWSLLGNHFDKSLLRIMVGFDLAASMEIPYASQVRLCKVFLDGNYMGIYTAIEPVDAKKGRVEIDTDNGDFIIERNVFREEAGVHYIKTDGGLRFEMSDPDVMEPEQVSACLALLNSMEAAIRTLDHTQYEQVIDVQSFVDFYVFHELIKDIDFGRFSTRYYVSGGILHAGPPWDVDFSMGNISGVYWETVYKRYSNTDGYGDGSGDSTHGLWVNTKDFYQWLCQDPWFMDQVIARYRQLQPVLENLYAENELGISRIDLYLQYYGPELESNYAPDGAGWDVSKPFTAQEYHAPAADYPGNVELLRSWLSRRVAWLNSLWLVEDAGV